MRGGDYVMMARRRAGLTQRQLAERLGLRQATIARWERGDRGVSVDDVELVAHACGLQLDAHLQVEDRSWWPQIAMQLELEPLERVRRLTPPGAPDIAAALSELAGADVVPGLIIGDVAGALHGWPLVPGSSTIEVCGLVDPVGHRLRQMGARQTRSGRHIVSAGVSVVIDETPAGTAGEVDLARNRVAFETPAGVLEAAGLIDLLRIADASDARTARRDSLALQAVLDVQREREAAGASDDRAAGDRIAEWLSQQTPVA
jgi:transcriptional regulator with XRE-family HTH domain